MATFALIFDKKCYDIIEADQPFGVADGMEWVDVTAISPRPEYGQIYDPQTHLFTVVVPPSPTAAEIAAARKAEILAALSALDAKSIRPLREGDTARVDTLEAQASLLRAELAAL